MAENSVVLLGGTPGRVIALTEPSTPSTTSFSSPVSIDGWGGYSEFKSILTRCLVSSQGNYQFLHSFGGRIYTYSFGDKIGTVGLSGLSFQKAIQGNNGSCSDLPGGIGIQKVMEYYNQNRIAKRADPITVTFAGQALRGMLTSFTADVANPESLIFQFDMQLALIPDNVSDSLADAKNASRNPQIAQSGSPDFAMDPPGYGGVPDEGTGLIF